MNLRLPSTADRDVQARVWVMSDLQTADSAEARRCLTAATDDFEGLAGTFDQLWYLGDAVSGTDTDRNRAVAETQIDLLDELGIPGRYVMGNHDLDPPKRAGVTEMPFYDLVSRNPNWRTTASPEEFYFVDRVGDHAVLFLSDHAARDAEWTVTHGQIHGSEAAYPYDGAAYRGAIEDATAEGRPLVVAGHNAFDGGNRPAPLQRRLLPLPPETVVHLYGHAHIGDEKYLSAGRNAYRTISYVDSHRVPQVDIASLEDRRGDAIRSAVLETYGDGGCGVHVRDHSNRVWLESYHTFGSRRRYTVRLSDGESTTAFSNRTQHDQLLDVIEWLAAERGLFEAITPPYHDEDAKLSIAETPHGPDGSEMRRPMELSNGWYLEGWTGKRATRRAIEQLADGRGLDASFDGLWAGSGE